jgi:hypothetical protein
MTEGERVKPETEEENLCFIAIFKIVGTATLHQLFEQVHSLSVQSIVSPSNHV